MGRHGRRRTRNSRWSWRERRQNHHRRPCRRVALRVGTPRPTCQAKRLSRAQSALMALRAHQGVASGSGPVGWAVTVAVMGLFDRLKGARNNPLPTSLPPPPPPTPSPPAPAPPATAEPVDYQPVLDRYYRSLDRLERAEKKRAFGEAI